MSPQEVFVAIIILFIILIDKRKDVIRSKLFKNIVKVYYHIGEFMKNMKEIIFIIVSNVVFTLVVTAAELPKKALDIVKVDYEKRRRPLKDIVYYEFCCISEDGEGCISETDDLRECNYAIE